ncbi:MAG TPA: hypothetical protein PLK55_03035 [archaeon]|nr:hypothetical protein [archaeon]
MFDKKGQVSIEILIILAMLVVGGVIFGVYYVNHLNSSISNQNDNDVDDATDTFIDSINRFSVEIMSPISDGTYSAGTQIQFTAGFTNNNGSVDCNWSAGSTQILTNTCSDTNELSPGNYTIVVTASDGYQIATDSVRIIVK